MSIATQSHAVAGRLAIAALNALLPPRCLRCPAAVDRPGTLCATCWEAIRFLAPPHCARCGFSFACDAQVEGDAQAGGDALCGDCVRREPAYGRARAVLRYDDASRALILGFKHGDRLHGAPAFGRRLARAGAELVMEADLIVPVPLHWSRLLARRYNQAALLSLALGRVADIEVAPDLLVRRRRTPSQGRLSRATRGRNVSGAFAVRARAAARVAGCRVLLIDDVLTTGATVEACARTLGRAGAAGVDVLTLARVVRGDD
jgi:ComF family protein